jgi:hypothetical protein
MHHDLYVCQPLASDDAVQFKTSGFLHGLCCLHAEPAFGVRPIPLSGGKRNPQGTGRLRETYARKEPQFDQIRLPRRVRGETVQRLVDSTQLIELHQGGGNLAVQLHASAIPAMFHTVLPPRFLDQDLPHRLGSRGKKVRTPFPAAPMIRFD